MNTFSQVWVFSDTPSRLPELMNGAQALANQINTFVLNGLLSIMPTAYRQSSSALIMSGN